MGVTFLIARWHGHGKSPFRPHIHSQDYITKLRQNINPTFIPNTLAFRLFCLGTNSFFLIWVIFCLLIRGWFKGFRIKEIGFSWVFSCRFDSLFSCQNHMRYGIWDSLIIWVSVTWTLCVSYSSIYKTQRGLHFTPTT